MLKRLRAIYTRDWDFFFREVKLHFILLLGIFFSAALISFFWFHAHPRQMNQAVSRLVSLFMNDISAGTRGWALFLYIFQKNLVASSLAFFLGFIPFLFLPLFGLVANGIAVGLVAAYSAFKGLPFFTAVAPHGIIEIPAMAYAAALGIYACLKMIHGLRILPVMDNGTEGESYRSLFFRFLRIVPPLLLLAAVIEAFVTPLLIF